MPAERLAPALALVAEVAREPTFPAADVERMRDERLNDLLQAKADPRRRADDAFVNDDLRAGLAVRPALGRHRGDRRARSTPPRCARVHARALDPAG